MKMIKVVGCKDLSRWYAGDIGKVFPYYMDSLAETSGEYRTVENSGYWNFIRKEDAQLVEVKSPKKDQ